MNPSENLTDQALIDGLLTRDDDHRIELRRGYAAVGDQSLHYVEARRSTVRASDSSSAGREFPDRQLPVCAGAAGSCTVTQSPPAARGVRVRVPS
jgi:hypothetical protein